MPLAINAGDAMFALSRLALYRLLDTFSERRVLALMRVYDETCLALCEGQYLDITFERQADVSVDAYLEMIGKKTAALVGASVEAGAILATDDREVVEAYRRFGYDLGMAFQMADDVKGSFWSSADSGKAEAGDIRKRKKTLPLVWAMAHADDADRARLTELYAVADGRRPGAGRRADGRHRGRRGARHPRALRAPASIRSVKPDATGISRSGTWSCSPARSIGSATWRSSSAR